MQLFMSPSSPYVRKTRVALRELGLLGQVEEIEVSTSPSATDPKLAAQNPLGKIPALLRPDGPAIYDSRVICRFLNDRANGSLYPESRIWEVLTLEALADGLNDATVAMTYETRVRGDKAWEGWIDIQWGKADRALSALEERWMPMLSGPVHIGQIATATALGYVDLRHSARGWRDKHPTLAKWCDDFSQRDAMVDTVPSS